MQLSLVKDTLSFPRLIGVIGNKNVKNVDVKLCTANCVLIDSVGRNARLEGCIVAC
jgi:hypothetical protein